MCQAVLIICENIELVGVDCIVQAVDLLASTEDVPEDSDLPISIEPICAAA